MPGPQNIAVIGIGNRYRSDDAAGLAVLDQVRVRLPLTVTLRESLGDGTELLYCWHDCEMAIAVDAVSSGATPGTVHRFDAHRQPLPAQPFRSSTHSFGLAEAIEMGRALDNLPRSLVVYGIEGRNFTPGVDMSRRVRSAVAVVSQRVGADVAEYCGIPQSISKADVRQ